MIKSSTKGESKSNSTLTEDFLKALKGDSREQLTYALHFYKGDICRIDYVEAVKWFKLAANGNNSEAFYYLGVCFEKGFGVSKNLKRAMYYYNEAYKRGNILAEKALGDRANNFAFVSSQATVEVNENVELLGEQPIVIPVNTECFVNIQYKFSPEQKNNNDSESPSEEDLNINQSSSTTSDDKISLPITE